MSIRMQIAVLTAALGGVALIAASFDADAGPRARSGARSSVNNAGGGQAAAANRGAGAARAASGVRANASSTNVNRNTNVNRSTSINREVDIDVDVDDGWGGNFDHPVAAAATAAAVTSAVIGSIAYSVPPSCVSTVVNGVTYQQCGSTWYMPQYAGTQVQYVVVSPP